VERWVSGAWCAPDGMIIHRKVLTGSHMAGDMLGSSKCSLADGTFVVSAHGSLSL